LQGLFGGIEQFAAFAGALDGECRVAANNEALARIVGAGDLGEITFIEQRQLQRAVIVGEGLDLGDPQGGDPVEPGWLQLLGDARLGEVMPRSPTSTTRRKPERCRSLSICTLIVVGSAVSPENTSTAIGQPLSMASIRFIFFATLWIIYCATHREL
jgi:hypothetical protein